MRDEQSQLFAYALRLLGRREYARMELQQKLTQWLARRSSLAAETEERVTSLLEQLTAEGLQDDDRFVTSYVRLCIMKGWGPIKISYHLRRKGIQEEKIKEHCEWGRGVLGGTYPSAHGTQTAGGARKREELSFPVRTRLLT